MSINQALPAWRDVLGDAYVLSSDAVRDRYARSTAPKGTRPFAVLRPANTAEVSAVAEIATRYQVPIYPISRGRNWGYGDACAVTDDQVIIDLGRMNHIHTIDETLAYAVVEPGVTQGQLFDALKGSSLWMDATGAGPDTSLIGNVVERGFGHTSYGDRFQISAGYEVVLPDGRIMTTGFGHYPNAQATYLYKSGVGPTLDGLFTQSNLGIVTRMGIWLLPKPDYVQGLVFSVPGERDIASLVEALRPLRLRGLLTSTIHIGNDLRVISSAQQYPWAQTQGKTPLPQGLRENFRKQLGLGAWTGTAALYGNRHTVAAVRKEVKRALRGVAKVQTVDDRLLWLGEKACQYSSLVGLNLKRLRDRISAARAVFNLLKGVPTSQYLAGAGWRSQQAPLANSLDPLDNQWGFFWLGPVLPMTGKATLTLLEMVNTVFEKFQFEPQMTLSFINARSLCGIITITYNKADAAESDRAVACHDELLDKLIQTGYIPYRCGIQAMGQLTSESSAFWDVTRQLKQTLDPQGILSPGRYIPF